MDNLNNDDVVFNENQTPPGAEHQQEINLAPGAEHQNGGEMQPWMKKRLGELTDKRRTAEANAARLAEENSALQQRLSQLQQPAAREPYTGEDLQGGQQQRTYQPTQAEIDQLVHQRAAAIANQQVTEAAFNARLGEVERNAKTKYGVKFDTAVDNLESAGVINRDFLEAVTSIDNSDAVLTYLGQSNNLEEAARITSLNPFKMGAALAKLSGTAGKALTKQVSSAPTPLEENPAGGRATLGAEPKVGTKEWIEWRQQQVREKGKR